MFKKTLSLSVIFCFFLTTLSPLPKAHADTVLGLPQPGAMVNLSPAYEPVIIKGLTVHKDNPFLFDFIVDVGQDRMSGEPLKKEGEKLIKYFLASLAIPDKDLWVNLSPYEKNRMIPEALGQTDMGRDLLEQDYILKQITASLIYPEKQLGKAFWDRVYAKAQEMYGTTQVPVNTFNKVWIMADKAEVFEHNQTAFVVGCHLKVMLEEDYLALQKHGAASSLAPRNDTHSIGADIVRAIILPELEKEVNTGKNFANLRQIFNSVILSSWYKKNLKEALLNQVYANKSRIKGIDLNDPTIKQQIYEQYLKAYKKGVFNYIKEDVNAAGATIPRKYFSGGTVLAVDLVDITDSAMGSAKLANSLPKDDGRLIDFAALASTQRPTAATSTKPADAAMVVVRSPQETLEAVQARIAQGIPDERASFIVTVDADGTPVYRMGPGKTARWFDYRADRQRQGAFALQPGFDKFFVPEKWRDAEIVGTTQYIPQMDEDHHIISTVYYPDSLPEVYAKAGRPFIITLSHEKEQFLPKIRGGHTEAFATEDTSTTQIPMPLKPDGSGEIPNTDYWLYPKLDMLRTAKAFAAKIRQYAKQGAGGFINLDALDLGTHVAATHLNDTGILNIERPDGSVYQVKGTGLDSALYYVQGLSEALQIIFEALQEVGGAATIISDHGAGDDLSHPGHSGNDVPLWVVDFNDSRIGKIGEPVAGGRINNLVRNHAFQRDSAPTHLQLAGISKPTEMTGTSVLPSDYPTNKGRFVATILTDGFGFGKPGDPLDAIQEAIKRGMAPTLKWAFDSFQMIRVPTSGFIAGLRGGKEKEYDPDKLLTKETVLEQLRVKARGEQHVTLTEIYYDFSSDPPKEVKSSKAYSYSDAITELEKSPFFNDRWFDLNETSQGVEVVYFDKMQIGSTEFNTAVIADGRIIPQEVSRVDESIRTGEFFRTPAYQKTLADFKRQGYAHFVGMLQESVNGVHASLIHLYYEVKYLKEHGITKFMFDLGVDGRDEGSFDSEKRIQQIRAAMAYFGVTDYYINLFNRDLMDRSSKWNKTQDLLDFLFLGHPREKGELEPVTDAAMMGMTIQKLVNLIEREFEILRDQQEDIAIHPTIEFIRELKNAGNFRLAVASAGRSTRGNLKKIHMEREFEVVVDGSDEPLNDKRNIFLKAARLLKVAPSHLVIIEDSPIGVLVAKQAGFGLVIGLARSDEDRRKLLAASPDIIVDNLQKLSLEEIRKSFSGPLGGFIFDSDGVIVDTVELHFASRKKVLDAYFDVHNQEKLTREENEQYLKAQSVPLGLQALLQHRGISIPMGNAAMTSLYEGSFIGLGQTTLDQVPGHILYVGVEASVKIFQLLKQNGFIDSDGHVTDQFTNDTGWRDLKLPDAYASNHGSGDIESGILRKLKEAQMSDAAMKASEVSQVNQGSPAMTAMVSKMGLSDLGNVYGEIVVVREGYDVTLDGKGDLDNPNDPRIIESLPTIQDLFKRGAKVILIAHLGRPQEKIHQLLQDNPGMSEAQAQENVFKKLSLNPVAEKLRELLGNQIKDFNPSFRTTADAMDFIVHQMRPGEALLLENLRFNDGEEANDPHFAAKLFPPGVVAYVDDAPSNNHRKHASMVGAPVRIPRVMGYLTQKETRILQEVRSKAKLAVIGGSKVKDKIKMIRQFLTDDPERKVLIGGAMANAFLKAKGFDTQKSIGAKDDEVNIASSLLDQFGQGRIVTPHDVVAVDDFEKPTQMEIIDFSRGQQVPKNWVIVDIGPDTTKEYAGRVRETTFWNGPMGAYDRVPEFAAGGTRGIVRAIALENATVGGGDSVVAWSKDTILSPELRASSRAKILTGGGASLEFLEGKSLPGVEALSDAAMSNGASRWKEFYAFFGPRRTTLRPAVRHIVADVLKEFLGNAEQIVDLGSGHGQMVDAAPEAMRSKFVQTDTSWDEMADNPFDTLKQQVDILRMPYPDGGIDALTSFSVLDTFTDTDTVAKEMYRVLSNGGTLLAFFDTLPAHNIIMDDFSEEILFPDVTLIPGSKTHVHISYLRVKKNDFLRQAGQHKFNFRLDPRTIRQMERYAADPYQELPKMREKLQIYSKLSELTKEWKTYLQKMDVPFEPLEPITYFQQKLITSLTKAGFKDVTIDLKTAKVLADRKEIPDSPKEYNKFHWYPGNSREEQDFSIPEGKVQLEAGLYVLTAKKDMAMASNTRHKLLLGRKKLDAAMMSPNRVRTREGITVSQELVDMVWGILKKREDDQRILFNILRQALHPKEELLYAEKVEFDRMGLLNDDESFEKLIGDIIISSIKVEETLAGVKLSLQYPAAGKNEDVDLKLRTKIEQKIINITPDEKPVDNDSAMAAFVEKGYSQGSKRTSGQEEYYSKRAVLIGFSQKKAGWTVYFDKKGKKIGFGRGEDSAYGIVFYYDINDKYIGKSQESTTLGRVDYFDRNGKEIGYSQQAQGRINYFGKTPIFDFDAAMATEPGGIDLNTSNGMQWKVSKDGRGVEMNVDPAMIERVRREGIDSLSPVIFRMTPVASVWPLVGLKPVNRTLTAMAATSTS